MNSEQDGEDLTVQKDPAAQDPTFGGAAESAPPPLQKKVVESKTKPVILYIVVMFAVALFLIILSFLMQQRNHNALMKGLSSTTLNTQTIVDLELETKTLQEKLAETSAQLNAMTADNKTLQDTTATLERKTQALEWLMELRMNYSSGKYSKARDLLEKMQEGGFVDALPSESALPGSSSPRAVYEEILSQLT